MIVVVDVIDVAELHPDERAAAAALPEIRAREHLAGRTALRRALATHGVTPAQPIGADDRGAPILPPGWIGSVSHKGGLAAAIVEPASPDGARIGIDLERRGPLRVDIARRIMTAAELARLPAEPDARAARVLLHFSVKEAIYKAIDPFLRRYVGFQEVELVLDDDAHVIVTSMLPLAITASYREHADHWLATARATLARG